MKLRKVLAAAILGLLVFAGYALAVPAENALSPQPEESVYTVLKLNNTGNFLRWILSQENIDVFMPLILAHEDSNEIIGGIEMARAVIDKMPIESLAFTAGATRTGMPFLQAAFTVNSSLAPTVRKIASGSADAKDIAKLFLGDDSPFAALAESMIKVQLDGDKYVIDNELILKSEGDLILIALSPEEVNNSLEALKDSKARLFAKTPRKFNTEDFFMLHVDPETLKKLDENKELDDINFEKYLDKPLNIELGFARYPDRFVMAWGLNLKEALKKKYVDKYFAPEKIVAAKGGYIDLANAGGGTSPLIAFGGLFNVEGMKETKETLRIWTELVKQVKRFNITEEELYNVLNGSFSLIINGSMSIEGVNIPSIFMSAAGTKGAAEKIYEKLAKSPYLAKLQGNETILQVDSSLSPVSCLITENNGTIAISMAEAAALSDKPQPKGAIADLMNREAISAFVIDFAGIQAWVKDNGVFNVVKPMASVFGYGKIAEQVQEVFNAQLSVPSFAMWAESPEKIYFDFAIENINAQDGLFAKLVKIAREYMTPAKTELKNESTQESK